MYNFFSCKLCLFIYDLCLLYTESRKIQTAFRSFVSSEICERSSLKPSPLGIELQSTHSVSLLYITVVVKATSYKNRNKIAKKDKIMRK